MAFLKNVNKIFNLQILTLNLNNSKKIFINTLNKKLLIWYKNTYIINYYTGKPAYTKNKGDKLYDDYCAIVSKNESKYCMELC